MMALARKLVSGQTDDGEVEDIFRQAQQVAAEADHLLFDAGWERPTVEPTPPLALPSGDEEPLAELVPCSSHHGQDEQRTLFSWDEFLAEQPDEQKPRGRNPRPAGPSLFDWALQREQEAGLVAAAG